MDEGNKQVDTSDSCSGKVPQFYHPAGSDVLELEPGGWEGADMQKGWKKLQKRTFCNSSQQCSFITCQHLLSRCEQHGPCSSAGMVGLPPRKGLLIGHRHFLTPLDGGSG